MKKNKFTYSLAYQCWVIDYSRRSGVRHRSSHTLPNYKPWNCDINSCISWLMYITEGARDSNKPMNCMVYHYRNIYRNKAFQGMKHTGHIEVNVCKDVVTITMKDDSYIRKVYDKS